MIPSLFSGSQHVPAGTIISCLLLTSLWLPVFAVAELRDWGRPFQSSSRETLGGQPQEVSIHSAFTSTRGPRSSAWPSGIPREEYEDTNHGVKEWFHSWVTSNVQDGKNLYVQQEGMNWSIYREYYSNTTNNVVDLYYGPGEIAVRF